MPKVITLPDGKTAEVPDDMDEASINTAIDQYVGGALTAADATTREGRFSPPGQAGADGPPDDFPRVAGEFAARRLGDIAGNVVPATGETFALGTGLLRSVLGTVPKIFNEDELSFSDFASRTRSAYEEERQKLPASLLTEGPLSKLSTNTLDVEAAAQSLPEALRGGNFGEAFERNRGQNLDRLLQMRDQSPGAAFAGDLAGDATGLLLGRQPFVRGNIRRQRNNPPKPKLDPETMEPGLRRMYERNMAEFVKDAEKAGLIAAETGVEGAFLAAANNDDPLISLGMASGAQAVGSGAAAAGRAVIGRHGHNLVPAAMGATALIQLYKSFAPAGRDRILESTESAFNKLALAVGAGMAASAFGLGRPTRQAVQDAPFIASWYNNTSRGALLNLMREAVNDPRIEKVLAVAQSNSDLLSPTARRRLLHAMNDPEVPFGVRLDRLAKADPKFKKMLRQIEREIAEGGTGDPVTDLHQLTPTQPIQRRQ
jgi:hypothetical protein